MTFWATLESSCECSRWSKIVVLAFGSDVSLEDKKIHLRFCDHMSLENHLVEYSFREK